MKSNTEILGKIHSIESLGTQDGPGIRFVFFMQGCPLRCLYCHNPDTWTVNYASKQLTVKAAFDEIWKVRGFIKTGGLTLSGGEPLLQLDFAKSLFKLCRESGIHTCIDTAGSIFNDDVKSLLQYTDLVLLDVKHIDKYSYNRITSGNLDTTKSLLLYLSEINKDTWIRYVLVPGLTDREEDLHQWAQYISTYSNVKRIDILPFHQMGKTKWETLGYVYRLIDTPSPSLASVELAKSIFRTYNLLLLD